MCDMRNFLSNAAGSRLFFNERDSDISIKVEFDGQRWLFPGHKLVLCTMSEVFRAMLETEMLEKHTKVITIQDSNPYSVKQFLKYLYMGIVDFNGWHEASNLLKIAHKYSVQTLINLSESYLLTCIVFTNACNLHELSRTYSLKMLKEQTQIFILDAGFIISATDGFFNLRPKSLESFLSNNHFNMENEGCILTCLREWAVCECSRRCMSLSQSNVLSAMEPFLKYVHLEIIPEMYRSFVPLPMADKHKQNQIIRTRKMFHFPASLQYHVNYIKFVVELGAFYDNRIRTDNLTCLKFSVDNHIFLAGFRIIGLFRPWGSLLYGPSSLVLSREDNKLSVQFNLNSLAWTRGAAVGKDIWREMIAYLPSPIRVDPFSTYQMSLRCNGSYKDTESTKWPRTRLDTEVINSDVGTIHFRATGLCYGITQLFVLPAPAYRNICNKDID